MSDHHYTFRVYYEDTDAGGVVYYANYLKFAERARTEMLRAHDIHQSVLLAEHSIAFVVRDVAMELIRPARLDDLLTVVTSVSELRGASLTMRQRIECNDTLLSRLEVKIACVDATTFRPVRLPECITKLV